jgi:hypothetical protein
MDKAEPLIPELVLRRIQKRFLNSGLEVQRSARDQHRLYRRWKPVEKVLQCYKPNNGGLSLDKAPSSNATKTLNAVEQFHGLIQQYSMTAVPYHF